jgi:enoyl-CoA hydratase
VNRVVPHDQLMSTAMEMARSFASKPPIAMRYAIAAVNEGIDSPLVEGQNVEALYFGLCCATEDKFEGMTAFLEKRDAVWKGR